jgi:hypothetical protein
MQEMNQKAMWKRGDRRQVMRKRVSHLSAEKSQVSMDGTPCRMQNSHRRFREIVVPGSKVKQSTVFWNGRPEVRVIAFPDSSVAVCQSTRRHVLQDLTAPATPRTRLTAAERFKLHQMALLPSAADSRTADHYAVCLYVT